MLVVVEHGAYHKTFFQNLSPTCYRHTTYISCVYHTIRSDPFTLSVVFVPLYALYELSAWVVKPASQKDDGNSEEDSNEILDEH